MDNKRIFWLAIMPRLIVCEECERKPPRARLFASGAGMEFYVTSPTVGIVDKLANLVMNKAIEINGTTRGITLVRREARATKVSPAQRKLL